MSRATVELDFFAMDKEACSKSRFHKLLHRQRSFRDIQGAISKIHPELLKSVISSGSAALSPENGNPFRSMMAFSVPSTPNEEQAPFPSLPIYSPIPRPALEKSPETAPLTIFYNGTVTVFDVPRDKAETIMRLAEQGISKNNVEARVPNVAVASADQQRMPESDLNGDLPIARKKSLQRFLEKRKERLTSASPFSCQPATRF